MRKIVSAIFASAAASCLLFLMQSLVHIDEPGLQAKEPFKLPPFVHDVREEELVTKLIVSADTVEPENPPKTARYEIEIDKSHVKSDFSAVHFQPARLAKLDLAHNNGEYLPIFRAPPNYPERAIQLGLCGFVDLSYTVTTAGKVRDPIVIASSAKLFESAAKKAALKYKYKPRRRAGTAVEVPGVEIRIRFQLEEGC